MSAATYYIAHDDTSIYGIGTTPEEALQDANDGAEGDYETSACTERMYRQIDAHGWYPTQAWTTRDGLADLDDA